MFLLLVMLMLKNQDWTLCYEKTVKVQQSHAARVKVIMKVISYIKTLMLKCS